MDARTPTYDELARLVAQQAEEITTLKQTVHQLKEHIKDLEDQLRKANRQAAPFRRDKRRKTPEDKKKKPGRKPGHHGSYRQRPAHIDHHETAPLEGCPHCEGKLTNIQQRTQFIEEIPPTKPLCIQLTTYTGQCDQCGPVESRHPLQTSTATGAAGNHLGPRAQAIAVSLAHRSGLTMRRVCEILKDLWGLKLSPGGLSQLLHRAAQKVQPVYEGIVEKVRESAAVFADETSWWVNEPWWLWVFTTKEETLYRVEPGRGSDIPIETLGEAYQGVLVSDCLASYNAIDCRKSKCIAHHLKVLKDHEQSLAKRGMPSEYLTLWKVLLKDVIATWKRRGEMPAGDFAAKSVQLGRGVENLLGRSPPQGEEVQFRNRLLKQREHLLGCLGSASVEPTNNRAERALRPAVISRKLSCGNRTVRGKRTWEVLRSVVTTLVQRDESVLEALTPHLQLPAGA